MKKFIINIVIFVCLIVTCDVLLGFGFKYLSAHAKGGDTGRNYYICHQLENDIIIFGSSRAIHHYDPIILEDSLGVSCYNCAKDGNGIIMMYGIYKMITERYQPKVLIYDLTAGFDLLAGDNNKFLGGLKYNYDCNHIDSIFWNVDPLERYKMVAQTYRYNSDFLQLMMDNIHPLRSDNNGYRPVDRTMTYEPKYDNIPDTITYQYGELKMYYIKKLIADCKAKGTKIIFYISPMYGANSDREYGPIIDYCMRNNIPIFNHYCDKKYVSNKSYFYDSFHMNRTGATEYTKEVAAEVKDVIK